MDHNNSKIDNKGRKQKTFDKIFITESFFYRDYHLKAKENIEK